MGLTAAAIALAATLAPSGDTAARPIRYESFKDGRVYFHAVVADMSKNKVTAEAYYSPALNNVWKLVGDRQPPASRSSPLDQGREGRARSQIPALH